MKQFSIYGLLLLGLFSMAATCKKVKVKPEFTLISAEKQTRFGGVAGSPVVTRYTIKLKTTAAFNFICDSAFAEDKKDKFTIQKIDFTTVDSMKVKKGKLITIVFDITTASDFGSPDFPTRFESSPSAKVPLESKTGIVLRYKGGKQRYFAIQSITEQPAIYAP